MIRALLAITCIIASARAAEWALPAANQGAWTPGATLGVGIEGGIAQYLAGGANDRAVTGNVINVVTAHSADNTGANDCRAAVQAAINAAASGDVIYFPAGTYLFSGSSINIPYGKPNVTLRGAGIGVTTFDIKTTEASLFVWPDPGYIAGAGGAGGILDVTGTKTKGTSTLSVSNTDGYAENVFAYVRYENEVDTARIQAGAVPVWSSAGYPFSRTFQVKVTAVGSGTITIDPALPGDATNLTLQIHQQNASFIRTVGWGVEDFSVTFSETSPAMQAFLVQSAQQNWFHNIRFQGWRKTGNNGSAIKLNNSYRCEVRKCRFDATAYTSPVFPYPTTSSDGAIETAKVSSCLIIDNIFTGPWGDNIYESGNSVNNVIAYNYAAAGNLPIFHQAHPSLNLIEGNTGPTHHSDGYHGSSSNNTLYRNWYRQNLIFNRFKRYYVIAGDIVGTDGSLTGAISWGNPNMSNGDASGFAGPTGLSDQVGQLDYIQYGGTPNTYIIQPSDVFAGDFWRDWEMTAVLKTRTSDTVGVFTVSGGDWFVGEHSSGAGILQPYIWWDSKGNSMGSRGVVSAISGSDVTITFPSGTLPAQDTTVQVYNFNVGWQERDLDVQATSTVVETYIASSGGTGAIQNDTADTLPASLAYAAKPDFFGSLAWPPFDPNDATTQDVTRIPAGYRYVNGNEDYLGASGTTATATTANVGTLNLAP